MARRYFSKYTGELLTEAVAKPISWARLLICGNDHRHGGSQQSKFCPWITSTETGWTTGRKIFDFSARTVTRKLRHSQVD